MNEKNFLKKTEYFRNSLPGKAEDGVLYVLSPEALSLCDDLPDFPYALYIDTSKEDSSKESPAYMSGTRYVLEGCGDFDPDEFDDDYLETVYRRLMKIPLDILETDRCLIRETSVRDLDEFYEIYSDPEITEFLEDLMERSAEEEYTGRYRDLIYEIYGHGIWTVIFKETGEVIGRAGLDERAGFDDPELGFMIGKKWQKKGFALEVCEAILGWAVENGICKVMSLTDPLNEASVSLLKKLGFGREDEVIINGEKLDRYVIYMRCPEPSSPPSS
ncbi:MAG: GNAT family N-acetyltransferase [Lachnospiraceae bacterium]|nr:GNAT family N-acetyltransferase [Lachnospiraceae bacterium]